MSTISTSSGGHSASSLKLTRPFVRIPRTSGSFAPQCHRGLVPLGTILSIETRTGSSRVERYNLYPAAAMDGDTAPGLFRQALRAMAEVADRVLPDGFGFEWTALASSKSWLAIPPCHFPPLRSVRFSHPRRPIR